MPRPSKCRKVCSLPKTNEFLPKNGTSEVMITLTVDEYETIRLIDKEGFSQEECAIYMQVARTTVQQIYNSARTKLANALVSGIGIRIEGGDYILCGDKEISCSCGNCPKHNQNKKTAKEKNTMKIAVTYENGQVFQHFGHTEQFKVYDTENGQVMKSEVQNTNGTGHSALAGLLTTLGVNVLICGGIGGGAQTALANAGIKLFGGVQGDADKAVEAFLAGNLVFDPEAKCNHHDHHHGEDHKCGKHSCNSKEHNCHS